VVATVRRRLDGGGFVTARSGDRHGSRAACLPACLVTPWSDRAQTVFHHCGSLAEPSSDPRLVRSARVDLRAEIRGEYGQTRAEADLCGREGR